MPHHFKDMTDRQFFATYNLTKEAWFENEDISAHVYIRKTTKKDGRTRSLIAPERGRLSQMAVFDDEIFSTGSYEFTKLPERWCPIYRTSQEVPKGGGELKPVRYDECYSAWSPQEEKYILIPTRWERNLMYCRPYGDFQYDDFEMELLPAAPGVNGANFKVNGGGGKSDRPKLGAGMRVYNAQKKPTFPDCHDNRYLKHNTNTTKWPHPQEVDEWYIPWGEFRPKFRYHNDKVNKGSITINFPITGIGNIIEGIKKLPRGRVTNPRHPEGAPYEPYKNPQGGITPPWQPVRTTKPSNTHPYYNNPKP